MPNTNKTVTEVSNKVAACIQATVWTSLYMVAATFIAFNYLLTKSTATTTTIAAQTITSTARAVTADAMHVRNAHTHAQGQQR